MPAYVISDVEFLDSEGVATYRTLAQESIAKYGGRYIMRGGAMEPVEGDWMPKTIIIVEFPTMARARVVPIEQLRGGAQGAAIRAEEEADLCRGSDGVKPQHLLP